MAQMTPYAERERSSADYDTTRLFVGSKGFCCSPFPALAIIALSLNLKKGLFSLERAEISRLIVH